MNCLLCGEHFEGRKRKYCSKECCKMAHGKNPHYRPEEKCLSCGKELVEGQKKYCSGACNSRAYHRRKGGVSMTEYREKIKAPLSRKEKEKQQRDLLTDRAVKRNIYITINKRKRGSIKYNQITPRMITEKRAEILAWRNRKRKTKQPKHCKICGEELLDNRDAYCSDGCRKEKARRDNYSLNKAKKVLKARTCKECGSLFVPEYGNKRRIFCSNKCLDRYQGKTKCRNARSRARKYGVQYQYVNPLKVFIRDGWKCQICRKKLKSNDRGKLIDIAPELDHIIPLSKGGVHSYLNTQCACRRCNRNKGNDERGQTLLFG